jgi:hypothetical protein
MLTAKRAENADSERFFLVILPKICVDLRFSAS